jgi:hypothetical protein
MTPLTGQNRGSVAMSENDMLDIKTAFFDRLEQRLCIWIALRHWTASRHTKMIGFKDDILLR